MLQIALEHNMFKTFSRAECLLIPVQVASMRAKYGGQHHYHHSRMFFVFVNVKEKRLFLQQYLNALRNCDSCACSNWTSCCTCLPFACLHDDGQIKIRPTQKNCKNMLHLMHPNNHLLHNQVGLTSRS